MSDYRFMLENHLAPMQARLLAEVQKAAAHANVNIFLIGGAIRDMLAGQAIRDLDFAVEGDALKFAKSVAHDLSAEIVSSDTNRKAAELVSSDGVTFEIGMARQERYAKPGGKPLVTAAGLHEDLRRRDFTINALGLSLNRASRGLLLDPTNGMGDLEHKELRGTSSSIFHDSPVRLLRLMRFRARLGFTIAEKTMGYYRAAREAGIETHIGNTELLQELRQAAFEPNLPEVLQAWDEEGLLQLVSSALKGPSLNLQSFTKLQKFRQSLPFGGELRFDEPALFFALLTENLSPKERAGVAELDPGHSPGWLKLAARAAKVEKDIAAQRLYKPSQVYNALSKVPGEQLLYLVLRSAHRVVQDRIRNYLQKYLPIGQEVTDLQVIDAGYTIGTPKFAKAKAEMIAKLLDARPKKPEPEAETV
jgi:tRNA nucleotidyltransferase (CCA-adding enzyme)